MGRVVADAFAETVVLLVAIKTRAASEIVYLRPNPIVPLEF